MTACPARMPPPPLVMPHRPRVSMFEDKKSLRDTQGLRVPKESAPTGTPPHRRTRSADSQVHLCDPSQTPVSSQSGLMASFHNLLRAMRKLRSKKKRSKAMSPSSPSSEVIASP